MSVIIDNSEDNAPASALPIQQQPVNALAVFIQKTAGFLGFCTTFALGIIAVFVSFDNSRRIQIFPETIKPPVDLSARLEDVERKTKEIETEQQEARITQEKLATRVADTARDLSLLVQNTDRIADESEARFAASESHMQKLDEQFSQMEVRLVKFEEAQQEATHIAKETGGETVAPRNSAAADTPQKPTMRLTRFSLIRLDGRAAWIAAPEGWLHVAIGEKLPGGARVLDVGTHSNRVAVVTDQGVITRGR